MIHTFLETSDSATMELILGSKVYLDEFLGSINFPKYKLLLLAFTH